MLAGAAAGYRHAAVAAIYALLALLLTCPALLERAAIGPENVIDSDPLYRQAAPGGLPSIGDHSPIMIDVPRDFRLAQDLRRAQLALWNPLAAFGAPLWAEQGGPFFPLKLIFYLAPSPWTYTLFLVGRLLVAALGAYALGRYLGLSFAGAFTAGALFELSGASVEALPFGATSPIYVLPWLILGAEAIARTRRAHAAAAAAVAIGVAGLGGHPTLILLTCAAFAVAIASHAVAQWRRPRCAVRTIGLGVLALLLGLCLAAPALLPLAELAQLSTSYKHRDIGEQTWQAALRQSRGTAPLALFAPHLLTTFRARMMTVHTTAASVGVVGLVLAVAGALTRRLSAGLIGAAALGIGLGLVPLGAGWLHAVPGLRLIIPTYAWPLVTLMLSQAAGLCIDEVAGASNRRRLHTALALVVAGFASLLLVTDSVTMLGAFPLRSLTVQALGTSAGILRLVVPAAIAAAAVVMTTHRQRSAGGTGYAEWILAGLAIGELLLLGFPFLRNPRSEVLRRPPSPAVRYLQAHLGNDWRMTGWVVQPASLIHNVAGFPMTSMLFGLRDARGIAALPIERYVEYLRIIDPAGNTGTIQQPGAARSPLLDLAAVRYIAVNLRSDGLPPAPTLGNDPRLVLAFSDEHVAIYENTAALPRARIVHELVHAPDHTGARALLAAQTARKAHADETALAGAAIVEPGPAGQLPPAPEPAGPQPARVEIIDAADADRLTLTASLPTAGFLVIADTYYPGWHAWVDGVETPLHPVNLLFRGLAVPAGSHRVELRYQPGSFRAGLLCAVAAAIVSVVLLIFDGCAPAENRSQQVPSA
jgi:hypothetical protein